MENHFREGILIFIVRCLTIGKLTYDFKINGIVRIHFSLFNIL